MYNIVTLWESSYITFGFISDFNTNMNDASIGPTLLSVQITRYYFMKQCYRMIITATLGGVLQDEQIRSY